VSLLFLFPFSFFLFPFSFSFFKNYYTQRWCVFSFGVSEWLILDFNFVSHRCLVTLDILPTSSLPLIFLHRECFHSKSSQWCLVSTAILFFLWAQSLHELVLFPEISCCCCSNMCFKVTLRHVFQTFLIPTPIKFL